MSFFFFIVNSVILPNKKKMLDPIAKKLILRVSKNISQKLLAFVSSKCFMFADDMWQRLINCQQFEKRYKQRAKISRERNCRPNTYQRSYVSIQLHSICNGFQCFTLPRQSIIPTHPSIGHNIGCNHGSDWTWSHSCTLAVWIDSRCLSERVWLATLSQVLLDS